MSPRAPELSELRRPSGDVREDGLRGDGGARLAVEAAVRVRDGGVRGPELLVGRAVDHHVVRQAARHMQADGLVRRARRRELVVRHDDEEELMHTIVLLAAQDVPPVLGERGLASHVDDLTSHVGRARYLGDLRLGIDERDDLVPRRNSELVCHDQSRHTRLLPIDPFRLSFRMPANTHIL